MVILKATSFLEGYKRDMGMTFRITPNCYRPNGTTIFISVDETGMNVVG
jgi:hypothetical protein